MFVIGRVVYSLHIICLQSQFHALRTTIKCFTGNCNKEKVPLRFSNHFAKVGTFSHGCAFMNDIQC